MATTPAHHRDYHDIIHDRVIKTSPAGPYRLCPRFGHRSGPAPTPASPHQSYEQLLAAEPLRIQPRRESSETVLASAPQALSTGPSLKKPASIDAIYELLSDGIFAKRSCTEPMMYTSDVETKETPVIYSASKRRRAPKIRTFIGGAGNSTHNVAIARRIRLGQQRERRCVQRSQSALLENLRSIRRTECDDCGVSNCDPKIQSHLTELDLLRNHFDHNMDDMSDNHHLSEATFLKHRARKLLKDCEGQLSEASYQDGSRIGHKTSGQIASDGHSASVYSNHHPKDGRVYSSPNPLRQRPSSQSDSHRASTPIDFSHNQETTSFSRPGTARRKMDSVYEFVPIVHENGAFSHDQESARNRSPAEAGSIDAIVHDIADLAFAPDLEDDAAPGSTSEQNGADPNEPNKSDQLRYESLLRIHEVLSIERRNQRVLEKRSLKSLRDVRDLIQANATIIARLRHEPALTTKKRHTLQQAKAKVEMAQELIPQAVAKIFLLTLRHLSLLAKRRRFLVNRLATRWPTIMLCLIIRTWMAHAGQASGPVRALTQRASPVSKRVRSRVRRYYVTIWRLRTRHLTLCKRLYDVAVVTFSAPVFFRWRALALRCQRLRASIAGTPQLQVLPSLTYMMMAFRGRCRAQIRQLVGADDKEGHDADVTVPVAGAATGRLVELAAALYDRWLRRTAYFCWICALHSFRRQRHLDALGQWHLLRRSIQRWRRRVSQIRNFIANSDERRLEEYLSAAFQHWLQTCDQQRRTRAVVHDVVYPHRLLKRCMLRWHRIASTLHSNIEKYVAILNQKRHRQFRHWRQHVSVRQRLRNVVGRIEALHLQLQYRRQWTRWRDRIRYIRLVTRVFRDAIARWTARMQNDRVTPVKAFSVWLRYVDCQRLKRIRRVQTNTAILYDGIRVRILALKIWQQVWHLRTAFRSWRIGTKRCILNRNRFLLKWRYLVPISKAFRSLRANVSVARRAEVLVWKAHHV